LKKKETNKERYKTRWRIITYKESNKNKMAEHKRKKDTKKATKWQSIKVRKKDTKTKWRIITYKESNKNKMAD